MPVHTVKKDKKDCRQYGNTGKVYCGKDKYKAYLQGYAIGKAQGKSKKEIAEHMSTKDKLKKLGSKLTPEKREKLPNEVFALPGRRYPIHDKSHARSALRLAHYAGLDANKVREAVYKHYPDLKPKEKLGKFASKKVSSELIHELNLQVNRELYSSYLYQAIANYLYSKDKEGVANWFNVQAQEEHFHYQKLLAFLNKKKMSEDLKQIKKPAKTFGTLDNIVKITIEHEAYITRSLHKLQEMALQYDDKDLQKILSWFRKEQQEEYEVVLELKEDIKKLSPDKLKHKLLKRKFKYKDPHKEVDKITKTANLNNWFTHISERTKKKSLKLEKVGSIPTLKPEFKLFDHQRDFTNKFEQQPFILAAHGTGSGKTLSAIAATEKRKSQNPDRKPTIVIAPAGLRNNYADEGVHTFTDRKAHIIGDRSKSPEFYKKNGKLPKADYYIMSYKAAQKIGPELMDRLGANHLIVDEAHFAKNPDSSNYKTLMKMRNKAKSGIFLTATPIKNKPEELVTLTGLAAGWSPEQRKIMRRISKQGIYNKLKYKKEPRLFGLYNKKVPSGYTYDLSPEFRKNLGPVFQKYVDYLPGESIKNSTFPEVKHETKKVPMDQKQFQAYQHLLGRAPKEVSEAIQKDMPMAPERAQTALARIQKARGVSSYYGMMDPKMDPIKGVQHSAKLRAATEDAQKIWDDPTKKDKRVLFFSNQVQTGVNPLSKYLVKKNVPHGVFGGKTITSEKQRQQDFKNFMQGKNNALIVSSAGQAGLSGKGVPYQFNIDTPWDIGGYQQQRARTIRSGSAPGSVNVQKDYVASLPEGQKGISVDEWMNRMLHRKKDLQGAMYNLIKKGK